jgi:inorganic phosphate transporter, PiT family
VLVALLVLAVGCVAFTNGANANFKGVASLYGSGTASRRAAALWGTATTFAGSLAALAVALFLTDGLLNSFGGRGVVPDALAASPHFLCAVALGAALTSFVATRVGMPVSTTHSLVGALAGAGVASGEHVRFGALGALFVLPLVVAPILAAILGAVTYLALRALNLAPNVRTPKLDAAHVLSTGAASFARGVNDTPKMAALLAAVPGAELWWAFLFVAIGIALGGLLDSARVAETLGKKLTEMNPGQGFASSLVTALLVGTASLHSVPASTTHVSVGALVGMGTAARRAHWKKVGEVLFAWASTAPCAALLAALALFVVRA